MRVDWCVSSWYRIKNTHSLTHSTRMRQKRKTEASSSVSAASTYSARQETRVGDGIEAVVLTPPGPPPRGAAAPPSPNPPTLGTEQTTPGPHARHASRTTPSAPSSQPPCASCDGARPPQAKKILRQP